MNKAEIVNRSIDKNILFKTNDEIVISKSPYSAYASNESDELVYKGKKKYVRVEELILEVQEGNLRILDDNDIDLQILMAIRDLNFATSRMITIYLYIKGHKITQEKVQKRLAYLTRRKAVGPSVFVSKDEEGNERVSSAYVYSLDTAAKFILKTQGIEIHDDLVNILKSKNSVKEVLARNQLMLNYLQNIKNIEFTKFEPYYKLPNGEVFQPHLLIAFENKPSVEYMYFEVIRSFKGWENKTLARLNNYKTFLDGFTPSKTMPSLPSVVLVAEDDVHALNIFNLIDKNNLFPENQTFIFTTDNRVLTDSIKDNSLFIFEIEGNKAHIQLITANMFVV